MRRGAGGSEEERVAGRGRLACLGLVDKRYGLETAS
jgi:hypothetical protein